MVSGCCCVSLLLLFRRQSWLWAEGARHEAATGNCLLTDGPNEFFWSYCGLNGLAMEKESETMSSIQSGLDTIVLSEKPAIMEIQVGRHSYRVC